MIAEALKAYSGRRVFVTGHTGFKGAWLCSWLDHLGASITGYALPAESRSLFNQARVADQIQSLEGDIRDLDRLKAALADAKPEIVFHMAAQSLVRPSYDEPVETFAINAMGSTMIAPTFSRSRSWSTSVRISIRNRATRRTMTILANSDTCR